MAPHTLAFGTYLTAMTVELGLHASWLWCAFFAALLALLLGCALRAAAAPASWWDVANDAYYPIAMNLAFPAMGGAVPAIRGSRFDDLLYGIDARFLGGSFSVRLEHVSSRGLTEIMSGCYLMFVPLLFASLVRAFFWGRERRRSFIAGLFTLYGIGFLGYLLVPASGPYLAYPGLFGALEGGPLWRLNQAMVALGSNGVDVFPSLHAAVSVYILGFSYRYARREFCWLLLPVLGICLSTLYLRYHYAVDVLCGLALAGIALRVGIHWEQRGARCAEAGPRREEEVACRSY